MDAHLAHNQEYAGSSPVPATHWCSESNSGNAKSIFNLGSKNQLSVFLQLRCAVARPKRRLLSRRGGVNVRYTALPFSKDEIYASVAQLVVQVHRKHQVVGSSPIGGFERERVSVTYVIRDEE